MEVNLEDKLKVREKEGTLRRLKKQIKGIDFSSNDYLGFVHSSSEHEIHGSTGSRLLNGNSAQVEKLEQEIADFHGFEAGLIFSSGYLANLGLFSAIASRGDTIILDEFAHASMLDGSRLSHARLWKFGHNDLSSLKKKLKRAGGQVFIGVESVYSMTGEEAPLIDLVEIATTSGADLLVDEAHAFGVYGERGVGKLASLGLQRKILGTVVTFGKSLGCHGAIVLGSKQLRNYLVNFARSFIYTTALPGYALTTIQKAYQRLAESHGERTHIQHLIQCFRKQITHLDRGTWKDSQSAIQSLIIPGPDNAKRIADELKQQGFLVYPILHPTVKSGQECIRFCLHAHNSEKEINALFLLLAEILPK